ncbi:hypothetical protein BgiMline_004741 [Biomphalaria glabrata]|nr:hypothetical protein BgiMline_002840 [Biomphalaria glabrata]
MARGRGRARFVVFPPRRRGRPRKYPAPTKDDFNIYESVNKVIMQKTKNLSPDSNQPKLYESSSKLPPLKIPKNRIVRCEEDDEDKTPEYPLPEDSTFFSKFFPPSDKEQRNVFSEMSTLSQTTADSNIEERSLGLQESNDNNIHSERDSDTTSQPKIKRLQMIPKLQVKTISIHGSLQELGCNNETEEKQEDKIPRLSPVEQTDHVDILSHSQPPKLKRICEDKVLFQDSISSADLQNNFCNEIAENQNNLFRSSSKASDDSVSNTNSDSIRKKESNKQFSSYDLPSVSQENNFHLKTSCVRTNTSASNVQPTEDDISMSQDMCNFELISEGELSPAPLLIDEQSVIENSLTKSSCPEIKEPSALAQNTLPTRNRLSEAPIVQSMSAVPQCEPLGLTFHQLPPPTQNSVHAGSVNSSKQLNAWMTGSEQDDLMNTANLIDAANLMQTEDNSITDSISFHNMNLNKDSQLDEAASLQHMCPHAITLKNIDNKTASSEIDSTSTNDLASVLENSNQEAHICNNFLKTQSHGLPSMKRLDSPGNDAHCLREHSGSPLTNMNNRIDKVEHAKMRVSQEPVLMMAQPKKPGRPRKSLDKETCQNTGNKSHLEHPVESTHHEAYRASQDALGQTYVRRRTQKKRNQLHFYNNGPIRTRDESYSHVSSFDKASNSINVTTGPENSYSYSYETGTWHDERNKSGIFTSSNALYVGQENVCTTKGSSHLRTTEGNLLKVKEVKPNYSIASASVHQNSESDRSEMPPLIQHGYVHNLQQQQPFPIYNGHKQFAHQEPPHANTYNLSQVYPVSTYGMLGARPMPAVQSSSGHCPQSEAQINYPSETQAYLHNDQISHHWPQTGNANHYVNVVNKPWSAFDTSLQNSSINSQRQPYVSLHGRNDYLHSDRLIPRPIQYHNQIVRPESIYHHNRNVVSASKASAFSIPNLMPTTTLSVHNIMPTTVTSVSSHRSGDRNCMSSADRTSMSSQCQEPQNNVIGHHNAKQRQLHKIASNPTDKETVYPTWVRVPDMSSGNKEIQPTNIPYSEHAKRHTSIPLAPPKGVLNDGVVSKSVNSLDLSQKNSMHDMVMVSNKRKPEPEHKTLRSCDEPLDLSVISKDCSQDTLRTNSLETYNENLMSVITNNSRLGETSVNEKTLRNYSLCDLEISSKVRDKAAEKIGNLFKESSSSEQQITEHPIQLEINSCVRDFSMSRASISDISCRESSVSDSSSISSNLLVAAPSPDIALLSPSGWGQAPRVSRSSSRTSIDSVEVTPPRKIGLPLEHFLNSTPSKTTYSSMMMAHITSKAKKLGVAARTNIDNYENHLMLSNSINQSVIDLTEGGEEAEVVSVSSYDSGDEESRIAFIESERNVYGASGPSHSINESFQSRTLQDNIDWESNQHLNAARFNSLKVNRAVKENIAVKVKEVVSLLSSSNVNSAAKGVGTSPLSNCDTLLPRGLSSVNLTTESSTEQAAATLLLLSSNPLYHNVIIIPETSDDYHEKVYQIQPMLGEDRSVQEAQKGRGHNGATRPATKTGRRVGRPPKDEVWPLRNEERPDQHGTSNNMTNVFHETFDHSDAQSPNAGTMSHQYISVNGHNFSDRFYHQPPHFHPMNPLTTATSFQQPLSSVEKKIDPKVVQLMKFRLNKKTKATSEMPKKTSELQPDQLVPLENKSSAVLDQTSPRANIIQDGIFKKKRKRRTKKEMMEAALMLSQNPHKKIRHKYQPRQKRKYPISQQNIDPFDPLEKDIVDSSYETRCMAKEIALTSYISPPATPELSKNSMIPNYINQNYTNQVSMQPSLHKNSFILDTVRQAPKRQSNGEELMNIEQFSQQNVVTEAHNEDGLVVISLQPAHLDHQLEQGLISPSRLNSIPTDLSQVTPHQNKTDSREEVIDWLTKNRKM